MESNQEVQNVKHTPVRCWDAKPSRYVGVQDENISGASAAAASSLHFAVPGLPKRNPGLER